MENYPIKRGGETVKKDCRYAACGALAGIANGMFGAGGGMILVPLFCRWCRMETKNAFATSVSVILPMSVVSSAVYLMRRDVEFLFALPLLIGGLIGGLVGGVVFRKVPTKWLRKGFALFLLYGGVRSLFF